MGPTLDLWPMKRREIRVEFRLQAQFVFGARHVARLSAGDPPLANKGLTRRQHLHVTMGRARIERVRPAGHRLNGDGPVTVRPSGEDLHPSHRLIAPQLGVAVAERRVSPASARPDRGEVSHGCVEARRPQDRRLHGGRRPCRRPERSWSEAVGRRPPGRTPQAR